jgi:nicotinamide mononucleotide transporter
VTTSWLEVWGFITGAVCVWLQVKENVWNWPIGIANNVLYVIVFWKSGLFADTGLQIFFIVISVYGWWAWLRGGEEHTQLKVSRITLSHALSITAATVAGIFAIAWLLKTQTTSTVPWGDSVTAALSLAATYMLSRKILENWTVWNVANVIYIALYIYKSLYLTAFLYMIFFAMCVAGHIRWSKELKQVRAQAAAV